MGTDPQPDPQPQPIPTPPAKSAITALSEVARLIDLLVLPVLRGERPPSQPGPRRPSGQQPLNPVNATRPKRA